MRCPCRGVRHPPSIPPSQAPTESCRKHAMITTPAPQLLMPIRPSETHCPRWPGIKTPRKALEDTTSTDIAVVHPSCRSEAATPSMKRQNLRAVAVISTAGRQVAANQLEAPMEAPMKAPLPRPISVLPGLLHRHRTLTPILVRLIPPPASVTLRTQRATLWQHQHRPQQQFRRGQAPAPVRSFAKWNISPDGDRGGSSATRRELEISRSRQQTVRRQATVR